MIELDAKSAADRIRADVVGKPDIPADARHALAFAKDVCAELGLDPDPPAMMAVTQALERAGIKPHVAQEYPKMLTENGKPVKDEHGNNVVFNSAEEEKAWKPAVAPTTVSAAPALPPEDPPKHEAPPKALLDSDDDYYPKKKK